ncbi:MAG: imidazoleglycerol-phosphate dehydratase HisB [Caldilineaceae bacterium SB0665_bin_21]|nr:imidazoleglycerol-phosphate dehydratase HisB [Caldilineaceae bacterium SB0665_bin_21]MYA05758.1 imidazoleglycerol-phosphate dehydratase HisB [Caldilineaceae bacterium SB0664_bin_22]MYC63565.1 imidazoleglycerol-phosphate dehydratase HisB [Caldilineaceae bacterium SB0661_bin_34]
MRGESRRASIKRHTSETRIELSLELDGSGVSDVATGIGMLDHMLTLFAHHGLFDLSAKCDGDLEIDEHHSAEDTMICLGQALAQALGDKAGIVRTAHSYVPMDETLARVAVDLSGRPYCVFRGEFTGSRIGALSTDLVPHLLESLAFHAGMNLHAEILYGHNDHHRVEAVFKALARALDQATRKDDRRSGVPSTKGTLNN